MCVYVCECMYVCVCVASHLGTLFSHFLSDCIWPSSTQINLNSTLIDLFFKKRNLVINVTEAEERAHSMWGRVGSYRMRTGLHNFLYLSLNPAPSPNWWSSSPPSKHSAEPAGQWSTAQTGLISIGCPPVPADLQSPWKRWFLQSSSWAGWVSWWRQGCPGWSYLVVNWSQEALLPWPVPWRAGTRCRVLQSVHIQGKRQRSGVMRWRGDITNLGWPVVINLTSSQLEKSSLIIIPITT